jgi:hypothetical protein
MNDRFDSPTPSLNDFPTDPPPSHDWLFWALATVCVVLVCCILTIAFMEAAQSIRKRFGMRMGSGVAVGAAGGEKDAIHRRAKAVMDVLTPSAKAAIPNLVEDAVRIRNTVEEQFGNTMELSRRLRKVSGKLNGALEGMEEKPYSAGAGAAPAQMSGGIFLNIVQGSDGKPVSAGPAAPAPAAPAEPVLKSQEEIRRDLWIAVQKAFDYWKNLSVVTAVFRAAQQQLIESAPWQAPEDAQPQPGKTRAP